MQSHFAQLREKCDPFACVRMEAVGMMVEESEELRARNSSNRIVRYRECRSAPCVAAILSQGNRTTVQKGTVL
jgi:hypothetical protein